MNVTSVYDMGVLHLNNRLRDSQERVTDHKKTLLHT